MAKLKRPSYESHCPGFEHRDLSMSDARPGQVFDDALQRCVAILPARRKHEHQCQRGQRHYLTNNRAPVIPDSRAIHGGGPFFHHHLSL